jgi:AcrR family transcriptional regulator
MPRPRFLKLDPIRQQEILDTSAAEFAANGYHGASLNRIQAKMGLSKGAFYYWFDDKEDLFLATLEQRLARLTAAVGGLMVGVVTEAPFFEQVHASIAAIFTYALAQPEELALVKASLSLGPSSSPRMVALWARGVGISVSVLETAQVRGEVREDLPTPLLASLVLGLLESLDRYMLATVPDPAALPAEETAVMYTALVERLLRP